jgi:hypothetical protein
VLENIHAIEALGIEPATVASTFWHNVGNRLAERPSASRWGTTPASGMRQILRAERCEYFLPPWASTSLALCVPAFMPMSVHERAFLVYNPTDTAPRGWYQVGSIDSAAELHFGSIVLARLLSKWQPSRGNAATRQPAELRAHPLGYQRHRTVVRVRSRTGRAD